MAFTMACPHCKKILTVTEKAFGRTLPCPGCNQPVTVPERPEALPPLRPVQIPPSKQKNVSGRVRKSSPLVALTKQKLQQGIGIVKKRPWILASVAGGLVVVLLLISWLFLGGSSERRQHHTVAVAAGPEKKEEYRRPTPAPPPAPAVPGGTVEKKESRQPTPSPFARSSRKPGDVEQMLGCGTCAGCAAIIPAVIVAVVVLHIALLVWVARDAKARGMDSAVVWMILVMFTGLLGLIIYLFSRPQGNVLPCPSCGNKRLQASAKCPHCGNA